jgi:hypothetical protein
LHTRGTRQAPIHEGSATKSGNAYAWLPKALQAIQSNPRVFADEDEAIVELGVGKNMMRSFGIAHLRSERVGPLRIDKNMCADLRLNGVTCKRLYCSPPIAQRNAPSLPGLIVA